jgi:kinesin family protein 3/17
VEGYNGTIFAYGQTGDQFQEILGCGKTFSMIGDPLSEVQKGIIPRAFQHIVKIISTCTTNNKYLIRCSYLEIYNEEIHDLIGRDVKARMEMKESFDKGVFIKDLNQVVVKSVEDMEKLMNYGNKNRAVGET